MTEMSPYTKICKYKFCREIFTAKRLNQEYCCNDHKIKANNWKAKSLRSNTKKIDYILHRNRSILESIYKDGRFEVTLNGLETLGFIYNYSTDIKKESNTNKRIPFYYEFGLIPINNNLFKIYKNGN